MFYRTLKHLAFPLLPLLTFFVIPLLYGANTMKLDSSAFLEGENIPLLYTCKGRDISPPLSWSNPPQQTQSFVLFMDDPDAPVGNWVHLILFNIPGNLRELAEDINAHKPEKAVFGKNSWGNETYGGPCPPSGTHRYYFTLYALDEQIKLSPGSSRQAVLTAMKGHILAEASTMGKFSKQN